MSVRWKWQSWLQVSTNRTLRVARKVDSRPFGLPRAGWHAFEGVSFSAPRFDRLGEIFLSSGCASEVESHLRTARPDPISMRSATEPFEAWNDWDSGGDLSIKNGLLFVCLEALRAGTRWPLLPYGRIHFGMRLPGFSGHSHSHGGARKVDNCQWRETLPRQRQLHDTRKHTTDGATAGSLARIARDQSYV